MTEQQIQKQINEVNKKHAEIDKKISKLEDIAEKTKYSAKKFRNEFNKAINTAALAAFGFLIALVWKDVITNFVNKVAAYSPFSGLIISAVITTFICVLGILLVARLLPFEEKK